jgi:hypothetical protein
MISKTHNGLISSLGETNLIASIPGEVVIGEYVVVVAFFSCTKWDIISF